MLFYYFDPTYFLVIAGVVICMIFSGVMKSTFAKYSRVRSRSAYTGYDTALRIMRENGMGFVPVRQISGSLTDHYDPRSKSLSLSQTVYGNSSVAAIGVAAHECGHALQHEKGFVPLIIRTALVPIVNVCSSLSWIFIILGIIISGSARFASNMGSNNIAHGILMVGIVLFSATVIFQLVTLPVEFDASRRGLKMLKSLNILNQEELNGARKVLIAAAFTYIAAALSSILQLVRLVLISERRR